MLYPNDHPYFSQRDYAPGQEKRLKNYYDTTVDPWEWLARNGHLIICGDGRMYHYEDKEFEKWIYAAYESLIDEGLESFVEGILDQKRRLPLPVKLMKIHKGLIL